MHDDSFFLTLTYDPEHLPPGGNLLKSDLKKFMQTLRKHVKRRQPATKVKFLASGEYGEDQQGIINPYTGKTQLGRPHFHLIIWGWSPPDPVHVGKNDVGDDMYTSATVEKLWRKGNIRIGAVTFRSVRYCASYVVKKYGNKEEDKVRQHYSKVDPATGEIYPVNPEFSECSRRPGLGHDWFLKHRKDIEKGFITIEGHKHPVPRYFSKLYEKYHPKEYAAWKKLRNAAVDPHDPDRQTDRLRITEKLKLKRTKGALERNRIHDS